MTEIVGEKKSTEVFKRQDEFVRIIKQQALDRRENRPTRNRSLLIE